MIDKLEIGKRLKYFGEKNFKNLTHFASLLEMKPQSLNSYIVGKSIPGGEILARLSALGCDIDWLLRGEESGTSIDIDSVQSQEYRSNSGANNYRVLGRIPAGNAEFKAFEDVYETVSLNYDPDTHFFLEIDSEFGYSMKPMVNEGDLALVSLYDRPSSGDLVAALWDSSKGALKQFRETPMPEVVALHSYNQAVDTILVKRSLIKLYRVVAIIKKKQHPNR